MFIGLLQNCFAQKLYKMLLKSLLFARLNAALTASTRGNQHFGTPTRNPAYFMEFKYSDLTQFLHN